MLFITRFYLRPSAGRITNARPTTQSVVSLTCTSAMITRCNLNFRKGWLHLIPTVIVLAHVAFVKLYVNRMIRFSDASHLTRI